MTPWSPNASGTASAQTSIAAMTTNIAIRTSALVRVERVRQPRVARPRPTRARRGRRSAAEQPAPGRVRRRASVVTCVIAKTKTRSKKSSSGVTRSTRADSEASTRTDAIDSVHDENVARRLADEPCADGAVDQAPQSAAPADDDHSGPALLGGGADLVRRISDRPCAGSCAPPTRRAGSSPRGAASCWRFRSPSTRTSTRALTGCEPMTLITSRFPPRPTSSAAWTSARLDASDPSKPTRILTAGGTGRWTG